ncbi:nucleotidyltransferase domain-containing protein [Flindersiella endophytica]
MLYGELVDELVEEARGDEEIVGVLLTGSVARGDALPGTDIDLRYVVADGVERDAASVVWRGVLVERSFADAAAARAALEANPMHVYAYLDGRVLYDPRGVLDELRGLAGQRFRTYRTPPEEKARIAFLLGCSLDKIDVAQKGGDRLKAAFVAGTSSWGIIEGLWAANDRPLPPNSSVRPHLDDLRAGPAEVAEKYERLFLGDTDERIDTARELIGWIVARLKQH